MPETFIRILKNGLLPILLGCGLFFINIRPYHDWGDDFAQYLQQAKNLSEGKPLSYSTHIRNPQFVILGPEAYPPTFPLLLTISDFFSPNAIIGGQYLVSVFLLLFGWTVFLLFLRQGVPWLLSLLLMLTIIYHPWSLELKSQVLSEFPFAFFFTLCVLLLSHSEKRLLYFIASGIIGGLAISTRSAGWVLPIAGIFIGVLSIKDDRDKMYKHLLFAGVAIATTVLINLLTGYYGSANGGYSAALSMVGNDFTGRITSHLNYYSGTMEAFFGVESNGWYWLIVVVQGLFWIGLYFAILRFRQNKLLICIAGLYIGLLLVFPFKDGFRFLIPIIPLLMLLSIKGSQGIFKKAQPIWILSLLMLNIAYQPGREYILSQQDKAQAGPQVEESKELFEYIRKNISDEDVVLFSKPRALAYYTQKPTSGTLWELNEQEFKEQAEKLGATHLLYYSDINYKALNEYVEKQKDQLEPVFSNEKFVLYQLTN